MRDLLMVISILCFPLQSLTYDEFNNRNYEIRVSAAKRIYKAFEPPQTYINQKLLQQTSRQHPNFNAANHHTQNYYHQFAPNVNYQQQQRLQQSQQLSLSAQQEQHHREQNIAKQAAYYYYDPTTPPFNDSLLHNSFDKPKFISQSECSQLREPNGNPRPFTRIITKCDVLGVCVQQNYNSNDCATGCVTDFLHQQILKLSKAQIQSNADKFINQKYNYQYSGNALTGSAAKALRGIPIYQGSDLKDRRLFTYSEVVIPLYPHN